jgi:hypothetical protein
MASTKPTLMQGLYLTLLYCLPVLLVAAVLLFNYKLRIDQAESYVGKQQEIVDSAYDSVVSEARKNNIDDIPAYISANLRKNPTLDILLNSVNTDHSTKELLEYYIGYYQRPVKSGAMTTSDYAGLQIRRAMRSIWLGNSFIVLIMALTPFMLLGGRLGTSSALPLDYAQRIRAASSGWWMKLIVAMILIYGWIYILNPSGRGASSVLQFIKTVDMGNMDTLPIFLQGRSITPVIAGFLGWYLYLLTYFFSKMAANDVVSSQVYGTMLQKFMFTWGVTVALISAPGESGGTDIMAGNGNIVAFLLGYFPMAAFSLIKDKGMTLLQGVDTREKGQLSELPGISRWQILRLEEEGINSLASLAYRNHESINLYLPGMAKMVAFWTDIARLYTIVGEDNYASLKPHCQTASEFVRKSSDPEFVKAIATAGISNPGEIARLLVQTFPT